MGADAAILELDNEGTTEEGTAMRCTATKGSATINAEGYTKSREEHDLDEEIQQHMGGLKKVLAQNFRDASSLKAEGNELLRAGRAAEAAATYEKALDTMQLAGQASVIMSESLSDKQSCLIADLHRNLAAAQLRLSDFEGALKSCDEVLKSGKDEKALYRRTVALLRLGRRDEAIQEVDRLTPSDPSVKKLRAEIAQAA